MWPATARARVARFYVIVRIAELYRRRSGINISTHLCDVEGLHVPPARDGSDATLHPASKVRSEPPRRPCPRHRS